MPGMKTLTRAALDSSSLGNMMVHEGLIGPYELDELLGEFRDTNSGGYFGQFLIEKGVLCQEKLELLLIRQAAIRTGGVESRHVDQAMRVASKTSKRLMDEVDSLMDGLHRSLAEKSVPSDTRS